MTDVEDIPTFDTEVLERITAAQDAGAAASGIPWEPSTDRQKREAEAYGAAMTAVSAIYICGVLDTDGVYFELKEFDTCDQANPDTGKLVPQGDMILQMLAAQRLDEYHQACGEDEDRHLDTRRAPGYVDGDPLTHTRLYVLTSRQKCAVALETPYDWQGYLRHALGSVYSCQAHLLNSCYDTQATPAMLTLVYKRGEYVFAWKICSECLDALSWIKYGDPRYAGPLHKWVDDGDRSDPADELFGPDSPDATDDSDWEI